jgi:hypothetical protein
MISSSMYFARSGAGTEVAVGNMGVAVGTWVAVAVGFIVTVGVTDGSGVEAEQDEEINVKRKIARMDGVNLFRMDCILLNYKKKCARHFAIKSPPIEFFRQEGGQSYFNYPSIAFFIVASVASNPVIICFFIISSMPGMLGIPGGVSTASICMINFVPSPSFSRM